MAGHYTGACSAGPPRALAAAAPVRVSAPALRCGGGGGSEELGAPLQVVALPLGQAIELQPAHVEQCLELLVGQVALQAGNHKGLAVQLARALYTAHKLRRHPTRKKLGLFNRQSHTHCGLSEMQSGISVLYTCGEVSLKEATRNYKDRDESD